MTRANEFPGSSAEGNEMKINRRDLLVASVDGPVEKGVRRFVSDDVASSPPFVWFESNDAPGTTFAFAHSNLRAACLI